MLSDYIIKFVNVLQKVLNLKLYIDKKKVYVIISLTQLSQTLYRQFIGGCLTDQ